MTVSFSKEMVAAYDIITQDLITWTIFIEVVSHTFKFFVLLQSSHNGSHDIPLFFGKIYIFIDHHLHLQFSPINTN